MKLIGREEFYEMTGRLPERDDLERCNCPKAGKRGHHSCGICTHYKPIFECQPCFALGDEADQMEFERACPPE